MQNLAGLMEIVVLGRSLYTPCLPSDEQTQHASLGVQGEKMDERTLVQGTDILSPSFTASFHFRRALHWLLNHYVLKKLI